MNGARTQLATLEAAFTDRVWPQPEKPAAHFWTPKRLTEMKDHALNGLVADLFLGDETNAATAKARYNRNMARIAELERGLA